MCTVCVFCSAVYSFDFFISHFVFGPMSFVARVVEMPAAVMDTGIGSIAAAEKLQ